MSKKKKIIADRNNGGGKKRMIQFLIYLNRIWLQWPEIAVRVERTCFCGKGGKIRLAINSTVALSLLGRREFGRLQYAAVHLADQWHCVGDTFIPTGRTPCSLAAFFTILKWFVTWNNDTIPIQLEMSKFFQTTHCQVVEWYSYTKYDEHYTIVRFAKKIQRTLRYSFDENWWRVPNCCPIRSSYPVSDDTNASHKCAMDHVMQFVANSWTRTYTEDDVNATKDHVHFSMIDSPADGKWRGSVPNKSIQFK